jgi:hypothetical protein
VPPFVEALAYLKGEREIDCHFIIADLRESTMRMTKHISDYQLITKDDNKSLLYTTQ